MITLFLALFVSISDYALAQQARDKEKSHPVTIIAGKIQHNSLKKRTKAYNGVTVKFKDREISGQKGFIDHNTGRGYMDGSVHMEERDMEIEADKVSFNLQTGAGILHKARGNMSGSFYFAGERIERVNRYQFEIDNGNCSTCPFPNQDWMVEASHVSLEMEGMAYIKGMVFRAGGVPIFYLPYFVMPAKTKRSTGFLIPQGGYSQQNGFNITNRFFWAIADNVDTTISHIHRGTDGEGGELEFRYLFSGGGHGQLNTEYFYVMDPEEEKGNELWKLLYNHNQVFAFGIENIIKVDLEGEYSIARQWEDDLGSRSRRYSDSFFHLRKNWSSASLNAIARMKKSVVPGLEQRIDEAPSVTFVNQKQSLFGLPVYWSLESGYTSFYLEQTAEEPDTGMYVFEANRLDANPALSAVLSPAPWISLEPEIKWRSTLYSAGVDAEGNTVEEPFTREFYTASAALTGPRFFRIFNTGQGRKIKHLISPQVVWNFVPDYTFDGEDRQKVKPFDAVDLSEPQNVISFNLVNQGLFKEPGSTEQGARVIERVKFTLSQSYDLTEAARVGTIEEPLRPLSYTVVDLKTFPADWMLLNVNGQYNSYDQRWEKIHAELGLKIGDAFHFAIDRVSTFDSETWDTAYMEFSLPWNTSMDFSVVFNETMNYVNDATGRLFYKSGCWGFGISAIYKRNVPVESSEDSFSTEETKVLFSIDLLGLGDSMGEVAKPLAGRKL